MVPNDAKSRPLPLCCYGPTTASLTSQFAHLLTEMQICILYRKAVNMVESRNCTAVATVKSTVIKSRAYKK